jgi:hypothetical protein
VIVNGFDPIDLVQITLGLANADQERDGCIGLGVEDSQVLVEWAQMLHRLWLELDQDEWSAVWAYEVAEPLGYKLGRMQEDGYDLEALTEHAEGIARELIKEARK